MIHIEELKKAGGLLEIRHDGSNERTVAFVKRKKAKIFPSLEQMIANVYFGINTEHFIVDEKDLDYLYSSTHYAYQALKTYQENKPDPNQLNLFES